MVPASPLLWAGLIVQASVGQPAVESPDCRSVVSAAVALHTELEAVTDTVKLWPHISPGTLHSLESDMHMFVTPESVCMDAV